MPPADEGAPSPYALPFVVALTGHRDLHPDDVPVVAAQLFEAIELIAAALPHSPIHFLSALADGADQLFAEQVLKLQRQCALAAPQARRRIELIVPLPMPFDYYCVEQAGGAAARQRDPLRFEADRQAFAARFLRYSAGAGQVFEIPKAPPAGVLAAPRTPAQAAYAQLTRYLGIHAQLLIAVWDGQGETARHPRRPGGTLDLVQTLLHGVERSGHPRSSNRFAAPAHGTVLHVYSRRAQESSAGLPSAQAAGGFRLAHGEQAGAIGHWDAPQPGWPGVRAPGAGQFLRSPVRACERWAAHRAWRALVARVEHRLGRRCAPRALAVLYQVHADGREIDTLNLLHQRALAGHDAAAYADSLRAAGHGYLASLALPGVAALPAGIGLGLGPLLRAFCAVDVLAERSKRYWSYRWRLLASAAVLAASSSSLRLLSPAHGDLIESMAFAAGACGAVAIYLWVVLSRQRNAYLDYRALAEGLRFQMYWLCAGEPALVTDHYVQKYSGDIGWVRHALDACLVVHPVSGLPARRVVQGWIADQLAYLNGNGNRRRRRRHTRSVAIGNDLLLSGLLCAAAALTLVLTSGRSYASLLALLLSGMKLATGVGAAWLSLNNKMGHGETLAQADQLRGLYGRARLALEQIEAGEGSTAEKERHARDLLFALGKAVLEENAGWLAAHQQRRLSWHGK
ncbi:hypothetical protein HUX88_17535 [Duganella sp. BJB1802]|uniref:hypothetical protein n=1 Tax=Duganella sp. BJB1802 TaxID=2744575 RepID=UPI00159380AE|nr:hypothetical protein [Duganella sp. BJB1802]NVD72337.1 hypothetical protein [Duganella sp. BJB1802]